MTTDHALDLIGAYFPHAVQRLGETLQANDNAKAGEWERLSFFDHLHHAEIHMRILGSDCDLDHAATRLCMALERVLQALQDLHGYEVTPPTL